MSYLLYECRLAEPPPGAPPVPGLEVTFWRPTLGRPLPPGLPLHPFLAWSLFHLLRVFRSRDYGILLLHQDGRLVHRTCVLPAHFKFPFMAPGDLQAAGIWTAEAARGAGLAFFALQEVRRRLAGPARTLWYLVREENLASVRLAEKAGLGRRGFVHREALPGLGPLSVFRRGRSPAAPG